ncbi:unnamed protein product [Arctogadus glacialis]
MRNTGLKVGSIRPLCRAGRPPCPAVARCRQTAGSPIGVLAWRDDISMCQNVKQTHTGYGMGGSSTANFGACGGVCSPLSGRWSPGLVLGTLRRGLQPASLLTPSPEESRAGGCSPITPVPLETLSSPVHPGH